MLLVLLPVCVLSASPASPPWRTGTPPASCRISGPRRGCPSRLESGTARDLATTASRDLHTARAGGLRNLGLSLAVLSVVTALGLVLRRSITRPLSEVWQGARTLSGGDLAFDVSYAGRDE